MPKKAYLANHLSSDELKDKYRSLNEEQFQELIVQLKKRPEDGGIWTGPKVAKWMEKATGIEKVWEQRG